MNGLGPIAYIAYIAYIGYRDSSDPAMSIGLNGTSVEAFVDYDGPSGSAPADPGSDDPSTPRDTLDGPLTDVRIYSKVLNADEVCQDATAVVSGTEPDLHLALPLTAASYDWSSEMALGLTKVRILTLDSTRFRE